MVSGYVSQLYEKEVVIHENNADDHRQLVFDGQRRYFGYKKRPAGIVYESAKAFPFPVIPRSEWDDRIAEMEKEKTRISDMLLDAGIPSLNQQQTNYCWCNAVVGCVQAIRAQQGEPYVPLSPASVAAPIKNYSNEGGWGAEALEYIAKNGVAAQELWPANAISRQYFDASRENAKLHIVTEFYELDSGNFDQVMTNLFNRIPTAIGLSWWSHEVMACDPVALGNGKYGLRFRNSWGDSYGNLGFNILTEAKATPDDACAPGVVIASVN